MAPAPLASAPERRRAFEFARLRLARLRVAGGAALGRALSEACEVAARTLQVERVGVWLFVDERRAIRCYDVFERRSGQHSEGAMLRAADFPTYFRGLEERRTIAAGDARHDELTHELRAAYLDPLGIAAMLDVPIYREGAVIGVVCHESGSPRAWTHEDRDFATTVAESVARQLEEAARKDVAEELADAQKAHAAQLQKMDALRRLAAGVAHDFKNVLQVVLGCAGEIVRDAAESPAIAASARQIEDAAQRGAELARELLAFGRDEGRATRVVDVAEVVEGFAPILRKAIGSAHALRIERVPPTGRVLIDQAQLERVLLNLVLNARDAMPEGGTVEISVGESPIDEGPGCCVVIEVSDTGVGMDADTRERLFEPFFTTKADREGTGIGMAVVYQIVERAGGFVHVESEPGRGTRIRVVLPRVGTG
jgi:two-component system, cell cycle sensor histidine kinase and response regulator CckA